MTITGTCKNECPPCSAPPQVIVRDEKQTSPSYSYSLLLSFGCSAFCPPRASVEVFAQRLMHAHSTLPPLILPLLLGHRSDLLRALMCATH